MWSWPKRCDTLRCRAACCRADAHPATMVMIETYMAALGFEKTTNEGHFTNGRYEVWDVVPRNALVDAEGDIFVVDAEIKCI